LIVPSASEAKPPSVPFEVMVAVAAIAASVLLFRSFGSASPAAFGANWEHMAVARSLAAGHGFANPFGESYPTGPTAVLAPVHPAMLAAIIALWGDRPIAAVPAVLAEVAMQTTALVLLLRISAAAFSSWIPGAIAAGAMLLIASPLPQWENASAWLALESVVFFALVGRKAIWTGTILGVGWLVSPSLIPVSLAAVAILRGWKYTRISAAVAVVIVAPWIVRNWLTFHQPVFLRDNFGPELLVSNNDVAQPAHDDSSQSFQLLHPTQNASITAELQRVGEPQYFRRLQAEAIDWIQAHPKRFLQLTGARIVLWWTSNWVIAAVNLLGLIGVWMNRAQPLGRVAGVGLVLYPLPYYVMQFDPRYAWGIAWIAALMAGYTCFAVICRMPQRARFVKT